MLGGDIRVRLSLDDDAFRVGLERSQRAVNEMRQGVDRLGDTMEKQRRSGSIMGESMRNLTMDVAILRYAFADLNDIVLAIPRSLINSASAFEKTGKLLEGLSKQTDELAKKQEAARDMSYLKSLSTTTPFDMKALSDSFVKFRTAGIDPSNGSLQALLDSVAKFGGGSDELKRASIAISQMAGKGVISMEELRQQLAEAIPNSVQLMARGMGMSMAELVDKVSKGVVSSGMALKKMFLEMEYDAEGSAMKMMETWGGMTQALSSRFEMFKADTANQGFFQGAKGELQDLLKVFDSPAMQNVSRVIGKAMADLINGLAGTVQFLADNIENVLRFAQYIGTGLLMTALSRFFGGGASQVSAFTTAIRAAEQAARDLREKQLAGLERQLKSMTDTMENGTKATRAAIDQKIQAIDREIVAQERLQKGYEKSEETMRESGVRGQSYAALLKERKTLTDALFGAEYKLEEARRKKKSTTEAKNEIAELERARAANEANIQVVERNIALVQKLAQEKAALINQMKAQRAELANSNGLSKERVQVLQTEIAATREKIKQVNQELSATNLLSNTQRGYAGVLGTLTDMKNRATAAVISFGRGMFSMVASMAGWTIALNVLSAAWDFLANRTKNATEAEKEYKRTKGIIESGNASEREIENTKKALAEKEELLKKAQSERLADGPAGKNQGNLSGANARRAEIRKKQDEDIAILKAQIAADKELIVKAQAAVKEAAASLNSGYGQKFLSQLQFDDKNPFVPKLKEAMQKMQKQDALIEEMRKANKNNKETPEIQKAEKERASIATDYNNLKLAAVEKEIEVQNQTLSKLEQGTIQYVEGEARIKSLRESLNTIAGKGDDSKNGIIAAAPDFMNPKGGDKAKKAKEDPFNSIREDLSKAIASAAQADDMVKQFNDLYSGYLSKLQKTRELEGKDGKLAGKSDDDLKIAASIEATTDIMNQANSAARSLASQSEKVQANLDDVKRRVNSKVEGLGSDFIAAAGQAEKATDAFNQAIAALEQAKKDGALKGNDLKNAENAVAVAKKNILTAQQMMRNQADIEFITIKEKERERIVAISQSYLTESELRRSAYDEELTTINARYDNLLEAQKGSSFESVNIEQARVDAIMQLRKKFDDDAYEGLQSLKRQWMDFDAAMRGATTNWATSISDTLVDSFRTGRLEIRGLLEGILTDIARIVTQRQIAEPLTDLLMQGTDQLIGLIGPNLRPAAKAGGQAIEAATPAVTDFIKQMEEGTDSLYSLAEGATDSVASIAESVVQDGLEQAASATVATAKGAEASSATSFAVQLQTATATVLDFSAALSMAAASAAGESAAGGGGLLGGLISSFAGSAASGAPGVTGGESLSMLGDFATFSANGNVVGSLGAMKLSAYASGGIAKKPTLSIFGEGRTPEAYVPLPDGRTIPVTMSGGNFGFEKVIGAVGAMFAKTQMYMNDNLTSFAGRMTAVPSNAGLMSMTQQSMMDNRPTVTGTNAAAPIEVNMINKTGQQMEASSSTARFDGKKYILETVLQAANTPGPFRQSLKGAMQ